MGAIIVTGVPGVGKTTVITKAAEAADVPVVVYGTQMLELAKEQGLVKDRDQMRKLPPQTQRDLQRGAAERIAELGTVIVDTHGTIRTPRGYRPGIPAWVAEALKPEMVVLIEADPEVIAARRADDATRVRDEDTPQAIHEHQTFNRMAAMIVAGSTGATVLTVENPQGEVEAAARRLSDAIG